MNTDILEIFAESAQLPSHVRERRLWRRALRERDRHQRELERQRLARYSDRFLRFQYAPPDPLPTVACAACGAGFGSVHALLTHERYWRWRDYPCSGAVAAE